MSNAPVPAAAEGMPNSTRRAFITSAAAIAVAAPGAVATAASPTVDPIFALIAAWEQADADWLAKLDQFGQAENACAAEKAVGAARIEIEICGVPFTFRTNEEISYFLRTLPNRGASGAENVDRLQDAGQRFRDALDTERERVEMVRSKHNVDFLKAHAETASDAATLALGRVVETVPTSLTGIRALAEFMAVPERLDSGHGETGLASLAAACRALLPAA